MWLNATPGVVAIATDELVSGAIQGTDDATSGTEDDAYCA
jgi:hypothetical protein